MQQPGEVRPGEQHSESEQFNDGGYPVLFVENACELPWRVEVDLQQERELLKRGEVPREIHPILHMLRHSLGTTVPVPQFHPHAAKPQGYHRIDRSQLPIQLDALPAHLCQIPPIFNSIKERLE